MGLDFLVCIPSTMLCAKVLCVVPLWCFPCFRWHVQGEVHWRYLTCPIRTATVWSPAGISVQWSWGYRSEDNDADDGFWNPLLRSVNEYEFKPDFFCINHINLLFGAWSSGVSKSTSSACPGSRDCRIADVSCFDVNSKTLRLSSGLWGVVKW